MAFIQDQFSSVTSISGGKHDHIYAHHAKRTKNNPPLAGKKDKGPRKKRRTDASSSTAQQYRISGAQVRQHGRTAAQHTLNILDTLHSTAQQSTAQQGTAKHSTAGHSTAQHSTAQHSTAQHSRAQRSTAQQSTAQQSTAEHSTTQRSTTRHTCLTMAWSPVSTASSIRWYLRPLLMSTFAPASSIA